MGRLALALIAMLFTAGCRDRGPGAVARDFVGALDAYTAMPSAGRLEAAYKLLDDASQQALEARAKMASELLSDAIEPWALLRFDGFVAGQRLVGVEEVEVGQDRSRVAVQTAWAVPRAMGGPEEAPATHELTLVRQDDGWRVALTGLSDEAGGM